MLLVDQPLQGLTARLSERLLAALTLVGEETPVLVGEVRGGPALQHRRPGRLARRRAASVVRWPAHDLVGGGGRRRGGGASIGLLASALGLASDQGRRLDLFPALAGAAVAVIAARAGGVTQFERMLNGVVVIPLVAVAGGVVALVVGDRPRSAAEATRGVLFPVSIAFAGQAALWQWTGGRAFVAAGADRRARRAATSWS